MSLLETNKLTWFQNNGTPLKSGYVYVGQAGLDPRVVANRKTVTFTDSIGGTATAAQPMRTDVDGRIQWNGKAIEATVTGDYSLLMLDSTGKEINGGWIPTVSNTVTGEVILENYREYGLTLADVKQLDVSPGQTVGNIGKTIAADDSGAHWLVVASTGSAADDIDLIDFDNGLQGQRIKNFTTEAATAQDKLDIRTNIDTFSKAEVTAGFQQTTSDVAGTVKTYADYLLKSPSTALNVSAVATLNVWQTIGKTGSGGGYEWSILDQVPNDAKSITLLIKFEGAIGVAGSVNLALDLRYIGETTFRTIKINSNDVLRLITEGFEIKVPVIESTSLFEVRYQDSTGAGSVGIQLSGFSL
jgi:hypothetical protein